MPTITTTQAIEAGRVAFRRANPNRRSMGIREFLRRENAPGYTWDQPFHALCMEFMDSYETPDSRQAIELPIRIGKSELFTIRQAALILVNDPTRRVLIAANVDRLAQRFNRRVRLIATKMGVQNDSSRGGAAFWETTSGGFVRAAGAGSTIEGEGFTDILCDDLIEKRADAESRYQRDKLADWVSGDLWGRREPGCRFRNTMSVWHDDDITHRLKAGLVGDSFDVLTLKALAEEGDPLGRDIGEALWEERRSRAELESTRAVNPYVFASRYQQSPLPKSGGLFRVAEMRNVEAAPPGLPACRAWDLASIESGGDATAGVRIDGPDGDGIYYVDPTAFRHEPSVRNRLIRQTAERDGVAVKIRVPEDPGAAGKESAATLVRLLTGFAVTPVRPTGDKSLRAEPFAAQLNAGNVRVIDHGTDEGRKAAMAYRSELASFPFGSHDDMVDASSDAFAAVSTPVIPAMRVFL